MVEHAVQLVDGVRAERVADLGAVERDAHHGQVPGDGAGGRLRPAPGRANPAVVGEVGEVLEAVDRAPARRVEGVGDGGRQLEVTAAA